MKRSLQVNNILIFNLTSVFSTSTWKHGEEETFSAFFSSGSPISGLKIAKKWHLGGHKGP